MSSPGAIALGAFLGGTVVEAAGITTLLWSATAWRWWRSVSV
ncbi:hypothetical protein [Streptomyces clavuligerus]|nr:hypothetical protein [Streptomyces clavuligerus]